MKNKNSTILFSTITVFLVLLITDVFASYCNTKLAKISNCDCETKSIPNTKTKSFDRLSNNRIKGLGSFSNELKRIISTHKKSNSNNTKTNRATSRNTPPADRAGISGIITSNNNPVEGVFVSAINVCYQNIIAGSQTDSNGNYYFTVPNDTPCIVLVSMPEGQSSYLTLLKFFNNQGGTYLCEQAESIPVKLGETTTGIDITLDSGSNVTGAITTINGKPVSGACVDLHYGSACGQTFTFVSRRTDSNGNYQFNLPPGYGGYFFKTNVSCQNEIPKLLNEWWDDEDGTFDCNKAKGIIISSQDMSHINFVLDEGNLISGSVSENDGVTPIPNVCISVNENNCQGRWIAGGSTDSNGNYAITVASGAYFINTDVDCWDNTPRNYVDEYWDGVDGEYGCVSAVAVEVSKDNDRHNINFHLNSGTMVSGNVSTEDGQPVPDICINVFGGQCWNNRFTGTKTDNDGNYSFAAPESDVYIQISDFCDRSTNLAQTWWNGTTGKGAFFCNGAVPIAVSLGQNIDSINFILEEAGTVIGTVYANDGKPLSNMPINAHSQCYDNFYGGNTTDENGNYRILGLPAGDSYQISAHASFRNLNYLDEIWDNKEGTIDCNKYEPVSVVKNETTVINLTLNSGTCIYHVIDQKTINIDGGLSDWNDIKPTFVDEINDQAANANFEGTDLDKLYLASDDSFLYVLIKVNANTLRTNTQYIFQANTTPFQDDYIGDRFISAYLSAENNWFLNIRERDPSNNATGDLSYPASYVMSGPNYLEFKVPLSDIGDLNRKYVRFYTHANNENVSDNNLTDVQIIDNAGKISGQVLLTDGQPITNIRVQATEKCGTDYFYKSALTDENGYYTLTVPAGTYYIISNTLDYFDEWWDQGTGTTLCIDAKPVTVVSNDQEISNINLSLLQLEQIGNQNWAFESQDEIFSSPAIGDDGTIYVGSEDENCYAINPDGSKKWEFLTQGEVLSSPAIGEEGTIYFGSNDGYLYAVNPEGSQKWAFSTNGEIRGTSPAIGVDGTIFIGSSDTYLYAVNPDGSQKWAFKANEAISGSPSIDLNGVIYVTSLDENLYAINPDGSQKWTFKTEGLIVASPALGADSSIYFGSNNGYFYAVNPDGKLKWRFKDEHDDSMIISSVAIDIDGTIYYGSENGIIYAIGPNGVKKWKVSINAEIYASPTIGVDGNIYIGACNGNFYSIRADGTIKGIFQANGCILSSPTIDKNGNIYFGLENGYLFSISSTSGGLANSPWPMFNHNIKHTSILQEKQEKTSLEINADVEYTNTLRPQEFDYYHFQAEKRKSLLIKLVPTSGINSIIFDADVDEIPLYGTGDYSTSKSNLKGYYELHISPTDSVKYYLSIYGYDIDSLGASYTVSAQYIDDQYVSDVSPKKASNTGSVTLFLNGINFTDQTTVSLVGAQQIDSIQTDLFSSVELYATFDLINTYPGIYSVQITIPNQAPFILENAFEISGDLPGHLRVSLKTPEAVRPARKYTCWLEYENDGGSNLKAPLLIVSNNKGAKMRLSKKRVFKEGSIHLLGINMDGPAGVLPPGASFRIPVYFQVPADLPDDTEIEFNVEKMTADSSEINWSEIEEDIRPANMELDVWSAIWGNFKTQMGNTWSDYNQSLNNGATYISLYRKSMNGSMVAGNISLNQINDVFLYDVNTLLQFELNKSSNSVNPRSILAAGQDVFMPAPGLSLTFGRFAPQTLEQRFRLGPLGRGWTHIYEFKTSIEDNGDIHIEKPGGNLRIFAALGDGTYQGLPGDYGSVSIDTNVIRIKEKDGIIWQLEANGPLLSIQDLNENKLTFSYSGSYLDSISHTNGQSITFEYDGNGRMVKATDPAGQLVKYVYDESGEHLISVEEPGGIITAYSYSGSDGTSSAHALKVINYPDGSNYYYAYDQFGRLIKEYPDGDSEQVTYTYNQGTVELTDVLGNSSLIRFGPLGEILEIKDPNDSLARNSFDENFNNPQVMGPDGKTITMAYDTNGNVIGVKNPLNQTVQMTFDPIHSRLTKLVDSLAQTTQFAYDASGNLESIAYTDASLEKFAYDKDGNLVYFENRRGGTLQYTYNERGQITGKTYVNEYRASNQSITYAYDDRGNLIEATDPATGTINMKYDERNFLSEISYPGGYGFTFEYNDAGQRTKRTSHDGFVLNYYYNPIGRLEQLTSGTGTEESSIVLYEYDKNGQLKKETKGNNTYTTYEYDAAGQLLLMVNYAPDGAVQSSFGYTYDVNGNRTSMTTLDGKTSYQYDDIGQLVGVTYPDDKVTTYEYDAAGNRIRVTDNGVVTDYTTNNMNQYIQVGNTFYTYDDDGNMITKTNAEGTTTYTYDTENRLIKVVSPTSETWEYTYDALSNRIGVTHDDVLTIYVHDPVGFVDVAAEYEENKTLMNRYIHSFGLVLKYNNFEHNYYNFDGMGNTRQVTNINGSVLNSYEYSPFGRKLRCIENVPNLFRYVGRVGVMDDDNGVINMRFRYYDQNQGRFTTQDPLGGITVLNSYKYVLNNPINLTDPKGLEPNAGDYAEAVMFNLSIVAVYYHCNVKNKGKSLVVYFSELSNTYKSQWVNTGSKQHVALTKSEIDRLKSKTILPGERDKFNKIKEELDHAIIAHEAAIKHRKLNEELNKKLLRKITNEDIILIDLASKTTEIVRAVDPNEIVGPPGVGDQNYVVGGQELKYTIYFENKSDATAPAQEVFVNNYFDVDFDWSTFRLGEVAFGDQIVDTMAAKESGTARVILDNAMAVDIEVKRTPGTGLVKWTLRSIDLETGELPEDAFAGFLPPNDDKHSGEGYVTYTIRTRVDRPAGTLVTNSASIIFDTNAPINTNEVFNTITNDAPVAVTNPNIANGATGVEVSTVLSWQASEYATSYDIYVWKSDQQKPASFTASELNSVFYEPVKLKYNSNYSWQVVARNVMGAAEGQVWSFTTKLDDTPQAPLADAGPDQTVDEKTFVNLDASNSSDPNNDIVSYKWIQTTGTLVTLSDSSIARPTFVAPHVAIEGESLTFQVEVTDKGGLKDTDTVIINISSTHVPPSADAGPDQTINEGDTVILDASNSADTDDGIASYKWKQISSNAAVTLSDANAVKTTFVAPAVGLDGIVLRFQLIVQDEAGLQSTDEVNITIKDNGITAFPESIICFPTKTNKEMGLKVEYGGNLITLNPIDPNTITETKNRPENIIYGLIEMNIKVTSPDDSVIVTIYLPEPAPKDYRWFKYSQQNGWYDYSDNVVFNTNRDQINITLVDGGEGDDDGLTNGMIKDPSGLGTLQSDAVQTQNTDTTSEDSDGGCFINDLNVR